MLLNEAVDDISALKRLVAPRHMNTSQQRPLTEALNSETTMMSGEIDPRHEMK